MTVVRPRFHHAEELMRYFAHISLRVGFCGLFKVGFTRPSSSAHAIATSLARQSNGIHSRTQDQVFETMSQVGIGLPSTYRETSGGGLVIKVLEF